VWTDSWVKQLPYLNMLTVTCYNVINVKVTWLTWVSKANILVLIFLTKVSKHIVAFSKVLMYTKSWPRMKGTMSSLQMHFFPAMNTKSKLSAYFSPLCHFSLALPAQSHYLSFIVPRKCMSIPKCLGSCFVPIIDYVKCLFVRSVFQPTQEIPLYVVSLDGIFLIGSIRSKWKLSR